MAGGGAVPSLYASGDLDQPWLGVPASSNIYGIAVLGILECLFKARVTPSTGGLYQKLLPGPGTSVLTEDRFPILPVLQHAG